MTSLVLPYNVRAIDAAEPRNGRRSVYKIEGVDGLRLHVLPSRRRAQRGVGPVWEAKWYAHYRLRIGDKRAVQQLIGTRTTMSLDEARACAREILALAHDRKLDPREQLRAKRARALRETYTFANLVESWLSAYAKPNLKAWDQPATRVAKHALPYIGHMPPADIRPAHISSLLDRLVVDGKGVQANRVRVHLITIFKWGLSRDCGLEYNPASMTMRPTRERSRSVVYAHAELRTAWRAIDDGSAAMGAATGLIWKLALVTGQRKGEIVGARLADLELTGSRPIWKLRTEGTKSAREHIVPLPPLAVELFRGAVRSLGRPERVFVFPAQGRAPRQNHLTERSVSRALQRSRSAMGLSGGQRVHDVRRTVNTELARLGVPRETRERLLNHAKKGVTDGVYNCWEYEPEKRAALVKWANELISILQEPPIAAVAA